MGVASHPQYACSLIRTTVFFMLSLLVLLDFSSGNKHTDIVLIGGMGDLSKKYLLSGFYNLITKHSNNLQTFSFYPSGRTSAETTEPVLSDILDAKINCVNAKDSCENEKRSFLKVTKYVQLKSNEHYQHFCDNLKLKWKNITVGKPDNKIEVIFYLSIPSSGYLSTANFINTYCRMELKNLNLKVVMEKPFGHDRKSAHQMSLELSDSFEEEEIYRVDHYLGKTIAREILNFRKQNENIEALLNRNHVDHIEIFMKEIIGVKGRIEFYDETGVIKDVFQNHLTELLTLAAMEIPSYPLSPVATKVNKLKLLTQIEAVKMSSALLGQYSDYLKEAELEGAELHVSKLTPTFAATVLNILSPRWDGVPVILVGGKRLDERLGYVRVVFKRNTMCVKKCDDKVLQQLVFHIGHGDISSPAIVMSSSLGQPVWPEGFTKHPSNLLPPRIYDQKTDEVYVGIPENDPDAYTVLIEDLYHGLQDMFVGTDHLLALWDIWTEVVTQSSTIKPRVYDAGDVNGSLKFRFTDKKLEFINKIDDPVDIPTESDPEEIRQTPATFLGHKLISTNKKKLTYLLASDLAESITDTLQMSWNFHVAFSGGTSPIILFETLAQHFTNIPWKNVHIWQVDERCVPPTDQDSNFRKLESFLLKYIKIPHFNIHPMPVDVAGKLCSPLDRGERLYQELIDNNVGGQRFDYIVLGLGTDGHTASIFPYSNAVKETVKLTAITDRAVGASESARMTLTFPAINGARKVSVLVTGKEKSEILKELEEKDSSVKNYPILGVNPVHGQLTWFVDEEAWS